MEVEGNQSIFIHYVNCKITYIMAATSTAAPILKRPVLA